ncbi:MAG: hypothetical protein ACRESV_06420 [Nevskiales bacterium]
MPRISQLGSPPAGPAFTINPPEGPPCWKGNLKILKNALARLDVGLEELPAAESAVPGRRAHGRGPGRRLKRLKVIEENALDVKNLDI